VAAGLRGEGVVGHAGRPPLSPAPCPLSLCMARWRRSLPSLLCPLPPSSWWRRDLSKASRQDHWGRRFGAASQSASTPAASPRLVRCASASSGGEGTRRRLWRGGARRVGVGPGAAPGDGVGNGAARPRRRSLPHRGGRPPDPLLLHCRRGVPLPPPRRATATAVSLLLNARRPTADLQRRGAAVMEECGSDAEERLGGRLGW
jgi:hypothetical protein